MTHAITGVAHIGIRVHDLARSRAFYEMLGFRFVVGPIGPEPVAILDHESGVNLNLVVNAADPDDTNVLMDVDEKHPGYTHVALEVADLEATQAHLEAHGQTITEGPVEFPDGGSAIFLRDPDRNVIELHRSR